MRLSCTSMRAMLINTISTNASLLVTHQQSHICDLRSLSKHESLIQARSGCSINHPKKSHPIHYLKLLNQLFKVAQSTAQGYSINCQKVAQSTVKKVAQSIVKKV